MPTVAPPPPSRDAAVDDVATLKSETAVDTACTHCGLPVPKGLIEEKAEQQFCCAGCRGVYAMIHGCGLDRYYKLRDALANKRDTALPAALGGRYDAMDDPTFFEANAQRIDHDTCHIDLRLSGVHCAACVWLVERLPKVLPGVIEARLSLRQSVVRVTWNPHQVALSKVASTLEKLGYPPHPAKGSDARHLRLADERAMLIRVGVAGACAGNAMLLALALYAGLLDGIEAQYEVFLRWMSMGIGMVAIAWPGSMFFRGALAGLRTKTVTLDLPIALAISVGGVAGILNVVLNRGELYFDSLSMLVFLLLVGRYIQMRQHRRATEAVTLMQSLTPMSCLVKRDGQWVELPVLALREGDLIKVLSGDRFAADGIVQNGRSSIDTATLTGESVPRKIAEGDDVFAGSLNVGATLQVRVTCAGSDTRISQLMTNAAEAVADKPRIIRLTDRIAGWFTLAVMAAAAAVLLGWWLAVGLEPGIDHAVALLIVACPCALGLATPLSLALAVGVTARRNILVKDSAVFEKLAKAQPDRPGVVFIDKTGTLTLGQLRIIHWHGDTALQPLIGHIESDSRHPVGLALHAHYKHLDLPSKPSHIEHNPRGGIVCEWQNQAVVVGSERFLRESNISVSKEWFQRIHDDTAVGHSLVWVAVDGDVHACISLGDSLRDDSEQAIQKLKGTGWRPVMMSGDASHTVSRIANELGLDDQDALHSFTPEQKLEEVRRQRDPNQVTVMVGDGVNDAAALAQADVGIAVHGGAEAAMSVADVYTARPGLMPLIELIEFSRFTSRVIRDNLMWSLGYNLIAVVLAAIGVLTPWIAVILMPVSSTTVLSLAMWRLNRWKGGERCR